MRDEKDGVNKVIRKLRYLRDNDKQNTQLSVELGYFRNNCHRMRYAEAQEKNYPIGSGVVEAACKTLVGQRLKRSGMTWQYRGGQGILTFRSLIKSDRFDRAWDMVVGKYKKQVKTYQNVISFPAQILN